jgi:hypothetical protein
MTGGWRDVLFRHSQPSTTRSVFRLPRWGPYFGDNIGSDGKHSVLGSREATLTIGDETTTINAFPVAGPAGSNYVDSDWNGSAGLPVTQLWDDTGHDITAAAKPGTVALNVSVFAGGPPADCLTPVANVVQE